MDDLGPGTALRDSGVAVAFSVMLGAVLAGPAVVGGAAVAGLTGITGSALAAVAGIGVVAGAGTTVVSRAGRWCGPADRVTLGRTVLIGGCATIAVLVLTGAMPARTWWLTVLLVPALVLDGVDGAVARRTGTASAAGARLDMEMDAALLLVLSVIAIGPLGWWVPALGGMRYAFVAAARIRPRWRKPLRFSQFRRMVAAVQGIALAVALAPVTPLPAGRAAVALALVLLSVSFGRDVVALERALASS